MRPDGFMNFMSAIPFIFASLIWLAIWIFGIIIAWRWMRAHERVAESLRTIAESWRERGGGPGGV